MMDFVDVDTECLFLIYNQLCVVWEDPKKPESLWNLPTNDLLPSSGLLPHKHLSIHVSEENSCEAGLPARFSIPAQYYLPTSSSDISPKPRGTSETDVCVD